MSAKGYAIHDTSKYTDFTLIEYPLKQQVRPSLLFSLTTHL